MAFRRIKRRQCLRHCLQGSNYLLWLRSIDWADIGTGTTVNAGFAVNDINIITRSNAINWAFGFACTTTDTRIVDYIGHNMNPPFYWFTTAVY
jgi:hypothetical protein